MVYLSFKIHKIDDNFLEPHTFSFFFSKIKIKNFAQKKITSYDTIHNSPYLSTHESPNQMQIVAQALHAMGTCNTYITFTC